MKDCLKAGIALVVFLLPGSVAGQQQARTPGAGRQSLVARGDSGQGQKSQPAAEDPSYVIGPEDIVDVSVWKEPEFTLRVPVRPDGKISMPLLNDIQAAGLAPTQLAAIIAAALRKYVEQPQVTVIVEQINSRRVYVLGEVNRPGPIALLPAMTVLQALATAGGTTQFAKLKDIYVLRSENGKQTRYGFDYKKVIRGDNRQNIILKPRDTIVVP